jgi:SAM-dependent methyltransferase
MRKDSTTTLTRRLGTEQAFHDRQAALRRVVLAHPATLRFSDDAWLDHETWIRPAFERLGDVHKKRVLDLGCGHGMAAVVLARRGAVVTAVDLSGGYLVEARWRAEANAVAIECVQADGESLPFAGGTFHRIWGNAVLHHLRPHVAGQELRRVLAPGGVAVFCEPWGENPFLAWARRTLPYPGKERTVDEEPLRWRDIARLREFFPALQCEGFQLLSMARRLLGPGRLATAMEWCDERLLRQAPGLWRFCRYVVLTCRR